jgi:excisionase family DNA binding protein
MNASTLTVPGAAEVLGVSERTVWRYLRSGNLTGETVGPPGERRTLIPSAEVARIAAERGRDPAAEALRAERDRLAGELALTRAERDRLADRLAVLQRALARQARPALSDRAAGLVGVALARLPSR